MPGIEPGTVACWDGRLRKSDHIYVFLPSLWIMQPVIGALICSEGEKDGDLGRSILLCTVTVHNSDTVWLQNRILGFFLKKYLGFFEKFVLRSGMFLMQWDFPNGKFQKVFQMALRKSGTVEVSWGNDRLRFIPDPDNDQIIIMDTEGASIEATTQASAFMVLSGMAENLERARGALERLRVALSEHEDDTIECTLCYANDEHLNETSFYAVVRDIVEDAVDV